MPKFFLRYGMVGGGPGAFVGDVHRKAAGFEGKAVLTAGCFSRNYTNTLAIGEQLGIDSNRIYKNFNEMAENEAVCEEPIDFVVVVTPNYAHYEVAKKFLQKGIHVVCDKPLALTVAEGNELADLTKSNGLLFCITYTYSGYPMIKQAREIVKRGDLGEVRMIMAEYPQDWLLEALENKNGIWRTDPKYTGISNCVGDIGTHIENTISYITNLRITSLCAVLNNYGMDQKLDTNASVLLQYDNGASGVYWSSQVAIGCENDLKIRIFGTKGSLEWEQKNADYLKLAFLNQPVRILSKGKGYLYPESQTAIRLPCGHPEGYYEAFANIYTSFNDALINLKTGNKKAHDKFDFPSIEAGLDGMKFIHGCVESSKRGSIWVSL